MKKEICKNCGKCCCYVATEIDVPEEREDFENIKWYVCHKNVKVFVDEEGNWYLEFLTPCEFLGDNNKCDVYERRPKICQKYDADTCLFNNEGYGEKYSFESLEDVEKYIKEIFDKGLHEVPEDED